METVGKYKVINNDKLWIQWSDKIESLLNMVETHLVNSCQHFSQKEVIKIFKKELFREHCACLAIYHMLLDIETSFCNYRYECYLNYIELIRICAFATQLEILENAVEEYYIELSALKINPEYILSDLYKAISELQVFLHEFNLSA